MIETYRLSESVTELTGETSVDGDSTGRDLREKGVRLGTSFIHSNVVCSVGL